MGIIHSTRCPGSTPWQVGTSIPRGGLAFAGRCRARLSGRLSALRRRPRAPSSRDHGEAAVSAPGTAGSLETPNDFIVKACKNPWFPVIFPKNQMIGRVLWIYIGFRWIITTHTREVF